jgi:hypothetical protein
MIIRKLCDPLRIAIAGIALMMPAAAGSVEMLDLGEVEVLSDDAMSAERGGFVVGGLAVNLGAEIRTFIDDQLVVRTNINWQDGVAETRREVSDLVTRVDTSGLNDGMLQTGSITMRVGTSEVLLANNGDTAIVFRPDAPLQSAIINTASGVNIRQEIDATIDLAGYDAFRTENVVGRTSLQLSSMLDLAMVAGVAR